MSERITQELRDTMSRYNTFGGDSVASMEEEGFDNHCDAIDSIHANLERENDRLKCELDRVLGELDEMHKTDGISDKTGGFMQNAEHHAWAPESHYMMLPKDAGGVPIHIGDVMEWVSNDSRKPVVHEVEAVGVGTFFAWNKASKQYTQHDADNYRHHHADSWERIIEDAFAYAEAPTDMDKQLLVDRCKALAGDAE